NLLAVNERQYGTILYISLAISIRDLCETIVERLKDIYSDPLPSDVKILSDEWIHLQFCPTNATTTQAIYYTSRFNWACLISADDKHKIPIEEDTAVSTGSFYDGQVFVSYKDTILEPSTAIRHSTKFLNALRIQYSELLFGMANTLDDIRKKAREFSKLESELKECISEAIAEIFESIYCIDSILKVEETTQAQICRHPTLVKFLDTYCQMHTYSFQIKKCNNPSCLYCKPIRLPPHEFCNLSFLPDPIPLKDNANHYATFQQVYGTKTTEEFRPTYIQSRMKSESIPKYILVAEKIRDYIECENCRKRRCAYSNKSLTNDEQQDYKQALESYLYPCGAPIFLDDHYLKE
ncbi:23673_t:CDS:2, partial [Gigaspora margarita]